MDSAFGRRDERQAPGPSRDVMELSPLISHVLWVAGAEQTWGWNPEAGVEGFVLRFLSQRLSLSPLSFFPRVNHSCSTD